MKPQSLRHILKKMLPAALHNHIFKAFDQVGGIAIIDVPKELKKYEVKIAQALINQQKTIVTVCKKVAPRSGVYRRQKLKILAGKRSYLTLHKENNARLWIHIQDVYYSPRMSTERKRIASLVKDNEKVLVMFSGALPYPCVIAKNSSAQKIVGIELNPIAHKYALLNIKLNKVSNVFAMLGDVRKVAPKLKDKWDRIVMAAPFKGGEFLDVALKVSKKGTIIHYYDFSEEDNINSIKQKVLDTVKAENRKCKVLLVKKCGQNAPRSYRVVVDVKMLD